MRTGCPRRDLPEEYGYIGTVIYDCGSERGLRAQVLFALQKEAGIAFNGAIASTAWTMT
ncbi:MAG: hypothetical protein Pg6C_06580 [Treponemataceae bacterium]|nr:MAG: hypothetical protein Pg6C_06580 [Treponemataceae bacterium]